jgi:transposase
VKGLKSNESLFDGYTGTGHRESGPGIDEEDGEAVRVSDYFVYRLKQRYKEVGTLAPKPHGGGHGPLVDEAGGEFLRAVLAEAPDLTLKELCERYRAKFARTVSKSSMDRALRRLNLTRKKRPSTTRSRSRNVSNSNGLPTRRNYPR